MQRSIDSARRLVFDLVQPTPKMNNTIRYAGKEKEVPLGAKAHNSPGNAPDSIASHMRELALKAGFSEAGVAALPHPDEERNAQRFRKWVAKGRAGTMRYLERTSDDGCLTRESARIPFPWARSVLVCFASYLYPDQPLSSKTQDPRSGRSAWIARYAWSSRRDEKDERRPSDYHKVLLKRLREVEARLHEEFGEFESRAYVDTGPVVERSLAVAAGVGWTGKNTCLIHPRLGSFGFLAVLLTSLDVSESASQRVSESASRQVGLLPAIDETAVAKRETAVDDRPAPEGLSRIAQGGAERNPGSGRTISSSPPRRGGTNTSVSFLPGNGFSRANKTAKTSGALVPAGNSFEIPDRCGSCTRCIDACPTHALDAPYQMDATRCIAYLTIEHKGPIAEELMPGMGRQVFGCDICQDVCPWNGKALRVGTVSCDPTLSAKNAERMGYPQILVDPELEPRPELVNPTLDWLATLDEQSFEQAFNGSPVRRAGFRGLQRNVAIAMGNSGLAQFVPQLEAWAQETDEGLRSAAQWALKRLSQQIQT